MREIKFRAFDTDKKCFCDNYDLTRGFTEKLDYVEFEADSNIELMQFTGLFDKNEIEIYEGDILSTADGNLQVI